MNDKHNNDDDKDCEFDALIEIHVTQSEKYISTLSEKYMSVCLSLPGEL